MPAYFRQIENSSPTTETFLTLSLRRDDSSLSLYIYTRGVIGCLFGFWPLHGPKPCRGNNSELHYGLISFQIALPQIVLLSNCLIGEPYDDAKDRWRIGGGINVAVNVTLKANKSKRKKF